MERSRNLDRINRSDNDNLGSCMVAEYDIYACDVERVVKDMGKGGMVVVVKDGAPVDPRLVFVASTNATDHLRRELAKWGDADRAYDYANVEAIDYGMLHEVNGETQIEGGVAWESQR